jgi:hypothetical protein
VKIERFVEDDDPSKVDDIVGDAAASGARSTRGKRAPTMMDTPFKSALELHARERTTTMGSVMSQQDIYRLASRDAVTRLNRPLSRVDIYYTGSTANLSAATAARRQSMGPLGRQMSVQLVSAQSHLSLPSYTAGEPTSWVDGLKAVLFATMDGELMRSPSFLLLTLSGFMIMAGLYVPFIYMARQAMLVGVSKEQAAFLVSILGIVNILSRICCGYVCVCTPARALYRWLSDQPQLDALTIHNVAVGVSGLATMAVPLFTTYWHFIVYCCFFGFGLGEFASYNIFKNCLRALL